MDRVIRALLFAALCQGVWATVSLRAEPTSAGSSREVSGQEMEKLQSYSRSATDAWLRSNLGLGLSDLELVWDPNTLSFQQRSTMDWRPKPEAPRRDRGNAAGLSPSAASAPIPQGLSLRLQQSDDLGRLSRDISQDLRDLPFGLEVKGGLPLLARLTTLQTRVWVPFSWRDEWRAEASLPLAWPGSKRESIWKDMGFGKKLNLRSDYTTKLGFNQVEAGLGTDWSHGGLGTWNFDYDYRVKYGQGEGEAIHWLKLSKEF